MKEKVKEKESKQKNDHPDKGHNKQETPYRDYRQTKKGTLSKEEEVDEEIDESFPASDPPANY